MEIITSVFWFNPFFHLIKKEISLIHEYLADKKAVKQSDTKAFAQMLLASHFSGNQLPATSPFLSSNLKKRLKMLQKPQTKFGYARRIFALPVLFTVAFAYMVNAKNKEIKKTNIEIEKAVSQIEKDTVRPGKTDKIDLPVIRLKSNNQKKIADLGNKIQEKSKALKELKPESKEFQKNLDEISSLSEQIGKITSSDDFLRSAMTMKVNGKDMKLNEYFNSEDWKNSVKELKNMEIEIPELSEYDFDFPDVPLPPNAPDAPSAPRAKVYKFKNNIDRRWSPEMGAAIKLDESVSAEQTAKIAKKRAEIERKRAKLNEKRAKLEGERAKLDAERRALDGNNRRVYIYNNSLGNLSNAKKLRINTDYIRSNIKDKIVTVTSHSGHGFKGFDVYADNMKIYIDGKEVTKKEMEALNSNTIKTVKTKVETKNGTSSSEIRIETK